MSNISYCWTLTWQINGKRFRTAKFVELYDRVVVVDSGDCQVELPSGSVIISVNGLSTRHKTEGPESTSTSTSPLYSALNFIADFPVAMTGQGLLREDCSPVDTYRCLFPSMLYYSDGSIDSLPGGQVSCVGLYSPINTADNWRWVLEWIKLKIICIHSYIVLLAYIYM